jgi:hypothetical protein
VSRSLGVTAATPSSWRDAFLVAGEASLPPRPEDGASLECLRLEARLGEMPYGLARVCRTWRMARATVYRHRLPLKAEPPRRPGPVGPMPDAVDTMGAPT